MSPAKTKRPEGRSIHATGGETVSAFPLGRMLAPALVKGVDLVRGTMVGWVADRLGLAPMAATIYRQYPGVHVAIVRGVGAAGLYTWQGTTIAVPVPS